ncbi:MAG: ABC transporter permease [Clostridiales bacterium]|nr:ABC transporter permease [Clostridiales bacterium]
MLNYLAKRVGRSLMTLFFIVSLVFCLVRQMPVEGYFQNYDKLSEAQVAAGISKLGLDRPLPVQLLNFYKNALQGDLGVSHIYRTNVPVTTILAEKVPVSLRLGILAMALAMLVGIPMGILMARSNRTKHKIGDKIGTGFIVFIQAVPAAVYFLFIQLMGNELFRLPMLVSGSKGWTAWILPVVSLALPNIAYYGMWLRRYMVDESSKDYVRLAVAKGVKSSTIMRSHIFRNAFVPMVQYIPTSFLNSVVGSIYIESLYSIPGMGGLLVDVIKRQDNTMVQAIVLLYATVGIIGLILGDLLMTVADPRIKLSKREGAR